MPEGKHLDYDDRKFMECSLNAGLSYTFIAKKLGVHETTISREVKRNKCERSVGRRSQTCLNVWKCETSGLCSADCDKLCKDCDKVDCTRFCAAYEPNECFRLAKKPYVCNGCTALMHRSTCNHQQWFYDAAIAQGTSDRRCSDSRLGIDLTADELIAMVKVVKPLLKKGQSLDHIWNTHPGEFPVTARTFYNYINDGLLEITNIDLPKKVKYKKRKSKAKSAEPSFNPLYEGRTYDDFLQLSDDEKDNAVEMDCVEGRRGSKKVILTLLFRSCNYQLMLLLAEHTSKETLEALDKIERLIGLEAFRKYMGVILTDRGHEFSNIKKMEASCLVKRAKRCKVYFCDPSRPDQKGSCEKNHVELRKVLPKKTSFKNLTQEDVSLVASHVNSYTRPVLNGLAPIKIAKKKIPIGLITGLGIIEIDPEEVTLKPTLLSDKRS